MTPITSSGSRRPASRGGRFSWYRTAASAGNRTPTALLAVGGVMVAVEAVMGGRVDNALCAVRPPGHHAERDRAMGFCFFNNVALGRGLRPGSTSAWSGWPSSTGTSTTAMAPSTCSKPTPGCSTCRCTRTPSIATPGTGYRREEGKGAGQGFTLNLPLTAP